MNLKRLMRDFFAFTDKEEMRCGYSYVKGQRR